jgi:hypothetical protein
VRVGLRGRDTFPSAERDPPPPPPWQRRKHSGGRKARKQQPLRRLRRISDSRNYSQTALPAPSAFATWLLYTSLMERSSSRWPPSCGSSDREEEGDLQDMAGDSVRDGAEDCEGVRDALSLDRPLSLERGPVKLELLGLVRKESSFINGRWLAKAELRRCIRRGGPSLGSEPSDDDSGSNEQFTPCF